MTNISFFLSVAFIASIFLVSATPTDFETTERYHPCVRDCKENVSMVCEYNFTLEYYVTMGKSCTLCKPNVTKQQLYEYPKCQCVYGDGYERGILTINRMIPGPSIQPSARVNTMCGVNEACSYLQTLFHKVCFGDTLIVNVHNLMEDLETTLHWHGLYQRDSQYFDGVPFVTQCPIPGGTSFRYRFKADKAGTHFYHSHSGAQKLDGLYGALIVRLPKDEEPHRILYDEDLPTHTIIVSDYMHTVATDYFPGYLQNRHGQYPDTLLINGLGRYVNPAGGEGTQVPLELFTVRSGVRYRFRIINSMATTCGAILTIERHSMKLIATDGDDFEPIEVDTLITFSGERFDMILTANQVPGDYWIQVASEDCVPNEPFQLAILRYEDEHERAATIEPSLRNMLPFGKIYNTECNFTPTSVCIEDLRSLREVDEDILRRLPDIHAKMPFELFYFDPRDVYAPNTYTRYLVPPSTNEITGLMNGISFTFPSSPPLSQRRSNSSLCYPHLGRVPAPCQDDVCSCPYTLRAGLGDVVEFLLLDNSASRYSKMAHPFHLHGHSFHVMATGKLQVDWNVPRKPIKRLVTSFFERLDSGNITRPIAKDTIVIPQSGFAFLRAKMTNPGYWFFHCHFVFHILVGMNAIIEVGEPSDLPPVPPNFPQCGDFMPT